MKLWSHREGWNWGFSRCEHKTTEGGAGIQHFLWEVRNLRKKGAKIDYWTTNPYVGIICINVVGATQADVQKAAAKCNLYIERGEKVRPKSRDKIDKYGW